MTTTTNTQSERPSSLLDTLYGQDRVVITAALELTNGRFLQPTGFPDIDACMYRDKEGRRWCLVESEQSMSNRLEAVCMKSPGVWVDDLKGLPLIAVKNKAGDLLATNLTEPHRVASSYILEGKLEGDSVDMRSIVAQHIGLRKISEEGDFWPLDKRADLEELVFTLDPAALLHGFQFIQWKFVGLRQTRLLHARLEAELAEEPEVNYGMVKTDVIEPDQEGEARKKTNKGQSIAAKSRIVPKDITATCEVDVLALKSLSLEEDWKKFLLGLALWKIGAFLANKASFDPRSRSTGPSLRLRADCYLRCQSVSWSGSSTQGTTSPDDLMAAGPAGLGGEAGHSELKPGRDFQALVSKLLGDASSGARSEKSRGGSSGKASAASKTPARGNDREKKIYEGPLVEVTYEPKPKSEQQGGGKAGETAANAEHPDDQPE